MKEGKRSYSSTGTGTTICVFKFVCVEFLTRVIDGMESIAYSTCGAWIHGCDFCVIVTEPHCPLLTTDPLPAALKYFFSTMTLNKRASLRLTAAGTRFLSNNLDGPIVGSLPHIGIPVRYV